MATVVDPLAPTDDAAVLYTCKVCGGQFPLANMSKSMRDGEWRVYPRCLPCDNGRKRRRERLLATAPRGDDGTVVEAILESDPWPARLLVELLREDRQRWRFGFAACWTENVDFVLARVPRVDEREEWRAAFESTRSSWQACWSNVPGPGWELSPALTDEPSSEGVREALLGVA